MNLLRSLTWALIALKIQSFGALAQAAPIQTIAVISDLNGSYGSTQYGPDVDRAVTRLRELKPDVVLSTGDMVAGQKAGLDYRAMWRSFHDHVTLPLESAGIPLAVTVGNHDGSAYPNYAAEREIFIDEWKSHTPGVKFSDASHYPAYYSFEVGESLFISIDSTQVGPLPTEQLQFVEAELVRHAGKKIKALFTHVPQLHFSQVPETESYFDVKLMELVERHGVNLFFSGHHHAYYPGFHGSTHFVSQSCLGAGARPLNGSEHPSPRSITILKVFDDHFEISALEGPDFTHELDHSTLPREIRAKDRTILLKDRGEFRNPAASTTGAAERYAKRLAEFARQEAANPVAPGGIVFAGSSSIHIWSSLEADFPMLGALNRGIGGSTVSDVIELYDRLIKPHHPRQVVFYSGTNDLASGRTVERVVNDLSTLFDRIHGDFPQARISFITLAPNPARWAIVDQFKKVNTTVESWKAARPYLDVINVFDAMLGPDGMPLPDIYREDRLHMNAKGYSIWKSIVGPRLVPAHQPPS